MKIAILGAGKMGSFFADVLSFDHEVALYDVDPNRLRFAFNTLRMTRPEEIGEFAPDLVINAATVKYTIEAFESVLPYLPDRTILSDIASVKTGLPEFYARAGHPFVSTHPMFGPTFANLSDLSTQHVIIITEGDHLGKVFFKDIYQRLRLNIFEYSFREHDETIAYSLSIPFTSTLVFASIMKHQEAPGTTFKKHLEIARGLLSEDDYLLTEILFNPNTPQQVRQIQEQMSALLDIIEHKDTDRMKAYLTRVRKNIECHRAIEMACRTGSDTPSLFFLHSDLRLHYTRQSTDYLIITFPSLLFIPRFWYIIFFSCKRISIFVG